MEWVETTGRTIDEAKELALDQLGVDASEAEFELVDEPKSGLFGRTRGTARVRARVVPLTPPPKTERRRGKKSSDRPASSAKETSGPSTDDDSLDEGRAAESGRASRGSGRGDAESSGGGRRNQGGGGRGDKSDVPRETMDMAEQQKVLEEFMVELAAGFGFTATATSTVDDNELTVNLTGEGLGYLVGPRLMTLDAVQEVARNTLQRQADGREYAKVVVDVEGIRSRRRDSLTAFVTDAAGQVVDEDVEVVFEVMSGVDRKQVHDVVGDLDGVRSVSEGEDPRRRVVLRTD